MSGNGLASGRVRVVCTLAAALTVHSACPGSKSHESSDDGGPSSNSDAGPDADGGVYMGNGGRGNTGGTGGGSSASNPRCLRVARRLPSDRSDKLDLLLVDNSNSMAGEQAALRTQFPKLIQTLSTGLRSHDDQEPFPPIKDRSAARVRTAATTIV